MHIVSCLYGRTDATTTQQHIRPECKAGECVVHAIVQIGAPVSKGQARSMARLT